MQLNSCQRMVIIIVERLTPRHDKPDGSVCAACYTEGGEIAYTHIVADQQQESESNIIS